MDKETMEELDRIMRELRKKVNVNFLLASPISYFKDDIEGRCSICGKKIYFRPYNKDIKVKLCMECFRRLFNADAGAG